LLGAVTAGDLLQNLITMAGCRRAVAYKMPSNEGAEIETRQHTHGKFVDDFRPRSIRTDTERIAPRSSPTDVNGGIRMSLSNIPHLGFH